MKKKPKVVATKPAAPVRKVSPASAGSGLIEESPAVYAAGAPVAPAPARAKTFRVGGSQAVRLPKAFRLPDGEVLIEKRGDEIVLKAAPVKKRMNDRELLAWVKDLHARHGEPTEEWPDILRPGPEANRPMSELEW